MTALETVALAHALLAAVFTVVATVAVLGRRRRAPGRAGDRPPVVLLRPVEALTASLAARLTGEDEARAYEGPWLRVLVLPGGAASALGQAGALAAAGLAVVASDPPDDAPMNRKVLHLAAGLAWATREGHVGPDTVLVQADADVVLGEGDVTALVDALTAGAPRPIDGAPPPPTPPPLPGGVRDSAVLAFAPPVPSGGSPLAAALARAILARSPQAFAAVHALAALGGGRPAVAGKLVALRASTLASAGGYAAVAPFIGDDLALVDGVRGRAVTVAASPRAVRTVDEARTVGGLGRQLVRWLSVAAAHRPGLLATYPLLVAPLGVSLGLVAACLASTGAAKTPVVAAFAALLVARLGLGLALALGPYRGHPSTRVAAALLPLLLVVADALLVGAALVAGCGRVAGSPLRWAGRAYGVGRRGRILVAAKIAGPHTAGSPRPRIE